MEEEWEEVIAEFKQSKHAAERELGIKLEKRAYSTVTCQLASRALKEKERQKEEALGSLTRKRSSRLETLVRKLGQISRPSDSLGLSLSQTPPFTFPFDTITMFILRYHSLGHLFHAWACL